jgi:hypothetical protein
MLSDESIVSTFILYCSSFMALQATKNGTSDVNFISLDHTEDR